METCKTRGIITRRADYGESNCMLTILTENLGVISACAYGVRSRRSKMKAGTQLLCCGDFVLSRKNSEIYRVDAVEIVDAFYPVCEDIVKLSLANYLCELSREMYGDGDERILTLLLNTLYALAYKDENPVLAKAVFEVKLAQYAGYEPCMDSCIGCGEKEDLSAFDFSGGVKCSSCRESADINISDGVYRSIRYILEAEERKIFSFTVSEEIKKDLSLLAEGYILNKSERTYKSLDYFKKML
ncbi:MAG: DNA repair protein RecO [Clostridia bacterium]|nr:DNA repair protein RecO [Clostridia bacterium]